jgi:predicted site-specific integrase-resolvase
VKPKLNAPALLTRAETAALFGVDGETVTKWADAGKLTTIRTPSNQRRYSEVSGVCALLAAAETPRSES